MALTLIATPGAANANSYVTVAEADAYFLAHPSFETWDRLYTSDKQRYLILATTQVDALTIDGIKYLTSMTAGVPDQALQFPRAQDSDDGALFIPQPVKLATYEQSVFLAERGGSVSKRRTLQLDGVKRIMIGDIEEEYFEGGGKASHELSPRAYQILNVAGLIAHTAGWL